MIDTFFEIIPNLEVIRGENISMASSSRKNIEHRPGSTEKISAKKMGRRGDLLLRYHDVELGCGEDKPSDTETKNIQDRGKKMPKMMRDMLWALLSSIEFKKEKSEKMTVLGVITFSLDLYLDWLTIHKGYTCVLIRSKKMSMPSVIGNFPSSLPLSACMLSASDVVKSVIDVLYSNEDYDIEFLKPSLKRIYSDDDDDEHYETKNRLRIVSSSIP